MQYINDLKAEALVFAHHFANTSQLYHNSNRGLYSENLASDSGSGGPSTTDHILSREFVCYVGFNSRSWSLLLPSFEILWNTDYFLCIFFFHTEWVEGEALTKVPWIASTWVGCADASNGNTHIQVCQYACPGNYNMDNCTTWLKPMPLSTNLCGAECHPDKCNTSNVEETPMVPQTTLAATVVLTTTQLATQAASGDRDADWVASHNTRWQTW